MGVRFPCKAEIVDEITFLITQDPQGFALFQRLMGWETAAYKKREKQKEVSRKAIKADELIDTKTAAMLTGRTRCGICDYCRQGLIEGAVQDPISGQWFMSEDALFRFFENKNKRWTSRKYLNVV